MTDQQRCPERWVNGIATFTVPLDIPVDASNLEKLDAAVARFGDEFIARFDGADVTFETSGEAGPAPVGGGLDEARQGGEGDGE